MKIALISLALITLGLHELYKINQKNKIDKTLRFNSNHEFTILQMTDLHYGESEEKDRKNMEIQEKLLKYTNPDMVVLTGDMVSGFAWDKKSKDFYYSNWKKFTQSFLETKTLYAYALGNHDHQGDLDYPEIMKLDKTHPYSLFDGNQKIDSESISNYNLKIYSSFKNKKADISSLLWIFDSKDRGCLNIPDSWGCITENQISWYEKQSKITKNFKKRQINGLSFFHIPPPEFMYMHNYFPTYLSKGEEVCCPRANTGFFERIRKNGNIKGMFCGHDHNNDFGGFYQGVELVYGRKTGYGCYGPPEGVQRGARVIKMKEFVREDGTLDFSYRHYIVQEDGSVVENGEMKWRGHDGFQKLCNND